MSRNALRERQIQRLDRTAKQRRFHREMKRLQAEYEHEIQRIRDHWETDLATWYAETCPPPKPWWRFW